MLILDMNEKILGLIKEDNIYDNIYLNEYAFNWNNPNNIKK